MERKPIVTILPPVNNRLPPEKSQNVGPYRFPVTDKTVYQAQSATISRDQADSE